MLCQITNFQLERRMNFFMVSWSTPSVDTRTQPEQRSTVQLPAMRGIGPNSCFIRWVIATKGEYLTGVKKDPSAQWTGQTVTSALSSSVQYVLVVSLATPSKLSASNRPKSGTQQTLQRTPLPRRPLWFPRWPDRPHPHLHPTPSLPNQQTKAPPLEHDNLLLLPLQLLRQHLLRLPLPVPRLIHSDVLGIPISV
jgi:hypothetical protein